MRGRGETPHEFTPRSSKSVGGLPIDVQTGGASTKDLGITVSP
ncbi:hypothetical protein [Metabacillus malikii]|uniref:Uncharacterized protein n=1 Tax=Metabacillus malikii TaxID=1504265 RepID=A0ABT9ZCN1_9BACI|nr:hypothetical protein [Metabacillus malikii]MDQ0230003.1 hypothetical protein [Metabacillus malikii]